MAQAASKTCEICVSAPGSCYCLECEQCFCENCKVLHSRQKISAKHEFKNVSDYIPEVKSKCVDHNEVFSFVCIACDVPVCVCCVTEKHNGHKLYKLKDIIAQLKTKIKKEILTKVDKTSGNVFKLEQGISAFNGQVETVIKSITEEGNKIKLKVDQYTANKIASLQKQARIEGKRLTSILSDHKTALDKANVLDNIQKTLEENRYDGTMVQVLKSLNREIDSLEVCHLPEFPSVIYTPTVDKENAILQLLGTHELCETKIGIDRKYEINPESIFECRFCGSQKTRYPNIFYSSRSFFCCNKHMVRTQTC